MSEDAATGATGFRPPARRAAPAYVIVDEPSRPLFPRLVVDPFAPVLATVCAGSVLGLAWMVLNGWAISSPTRRRETAIAASAIAGLGILVVFAGILLAADGVTERAFALWVVLLRGITLAAAYAIYRSQVTGFRRHLEAGRRVVPGWPAVVCLAGLRAVVVAVAMRTTASIAAMGLVVSL
ncbi:MAG: hypothetical protein IT376_01335 [Polyangiaceae bacterium]|nr:hypothetical protein [Polyangiaceae bacterium]